MATSTLRPWHRNSHLRLLNIKLALSYWCFFVWERELIRCVRESDSLSLSLSLSRSLYILYVCVRVRVPFSPLRKVLKQILSHSFQRLICFVCLLGILYGDICTAHFAESLFRTCFYTLKRGMIHALTVSAVWNYWMSLNIYICTENQYQVS